MDMSNQIKCSTTTTRVLLGLVLLVAGLMKLLVMGHAAVSGMLGGMSLFSWAPGFWAWVLILAEILSGIAIVANYKMKWSTVPGIIIFVVATFTAHRGNWGQMLTHLTLASTLWMFRANSEE
jgi:uncharacterized membrane protein YphA (DoxX/SURF4 family)